MGGGSETGTPSGKHYRRRRLLERDPGRQETLKRGPDLGAGVPTGLVQTPAKHPGRRESTGKLDNVPLIFLGVIRLTKVTEHRAYSFFSFLYHATHIVRAIFSFLIANYRVSVASFFPSSDSAECNCSFKWK